MGPLGHRAQIAEFDGHVRWRRTLTFSLSGSTAASASSVQYCGGRPRRRVARNAFGAPRFRSALSADQGLSISLVIFFAKAQRASTSSSCIQRASLCQPSGPRCTSTLSQLVTRQSFSNAVPEARRNAVRSASPAEAAAPTWPPAASVAPSRLISAVARPTTSPSSAGILSGASVSGRDDASLPAAPRASFASRDTERS